MTYVTMSKQELMEIRGRAAEFASKKNSQQNKSPKSIDVEIVLHDTYLLMTIQSMQEQEDAEVILAKLVSFLERNIKISKGIDYE